MMVPAFALNVPGALLLSLRLPLRPDPCPGPGTISYSPCSSRLIRRTEISILETCASELPSTPRLCSSISRLAGPLPSILFLFLPTPSSSSSSESEALPGRKALRSPSSMSSRLFRDAREGVRVSARTMLSVSSAVPFDVAGSVRMASAS